MPDNVLLMPSRYMERTKKLLLEAKQRELAMEALNKQGYRPSKKQSDNLFGRAVKSAVGLKEVVKDVSRESMDALEDYGNQVQSVPAALFTKGTVEDGKYTTSRNLIGNPFANVTSHIRAQRQAGLLDEPSGLLDTVTEGFKAANRAGRAYSEDPDISAGTKFATGVGLDPTTYIGAGVLSKAARLSGKTGISSRFARGALGVAEGFETPAQALKFTAGGALGTELASRTDIPGVSEGIEQMGGGLLGGGLANFRRPRASTNMKQVVEKYGPGEFPSKEQINQEWQDLFEQGVKLTDEGRADEAELLRPHMDELSNLSDHYDDMRRMHEAIRGDQETMLSNPGGFDEAEINRISLKREPLTDQEQELWERFTLTSDREDIGSLTQAEAAQRNRLVNFEDPSQLDDADLSIRIQNLSNRVNSYADQGREYFEERGNLQKYNEEAARRGINPAEVTDKLFGEPQTVYHGTSSDLEGGKLNYDSYVTTSREAAETFARADARLTGGEPRVYTFRAKPGALKPTGTDDFASSFGGALLVERPDDLLWLRSQDESPTAIRGGAAPERLVEPRAVEFGLTGTEKVGNILTEVKRFLLGHGVKNDSIATPMAKEYLRINNVLKNQANQLGKKVARASKILNIDEATGKIDTTALTAPQREVYDSLQFALDGWEETLNQFGTKFDDIEKFTAKVRAEAGNERKTIADIYQEYANAIANKVSGKWLGNEVKNLGGNVQTLQQMGKSVPTRTVNLPGASKVKLPPEIADALQRAVKQVHPSKPSEATELFNAVNNTLRGLWAAGDASFVGIQQLLTWADNPALASKVLHGSYKALRDPAAFAKWAEQHDKARFGSKPTIADYARGGLHIAQATGEGTDLGGIAGAVQRAPVYGRFQKLTNRMFTESGNFNRVMLADNLWERMESGIPIVHGIDPKNMTREEKLAAIAKAANRATGYSEKPFGGAYGSAIFFAPRFMQSQIELLIKAVSDGSIEGQVARRQLLKLMAIGTGLTVAMNEARGEETEFDPRNSNFMRIKDVGGADISIFGPWDTLVKGVIRSVPHVDEDGDFEMGDPTYLMRSKLSPVLSTTIDMISGENVLGEPVGFKGEKGDLLQLRNLLAPFAMRKVGEEPLSSTALGFLGAKGTPLSNTEVLENRLEEAGITKDDPDFLIKRREWMAQNPDLIPKAERGEFKRVGEIRTDISQRRTANDELTTSNGQSLVEFREKRKLLLTEQRNRLAEVIKTETKTKGPNSKYLESYFKLFDDKSILDPITQEIDPDAFDQKVAEWANKNGTQALDFVQQYLGAGLGTAEKAYYNDMRTLDSIGYFDKPKYQNMKSGLTEEEIDSLAAQVDALRAGNPKLQSQSWAKTAKMVLSETLDDTELLDILHSRLDKYQSKEREELKQQYGKELLWFNSRANWDSYVNYTPSKKEKAARSSRKSFELSSDTLKLKPSIGLKIS